jgi:hypothetical protein
MARVYGDKEIAQRISELIKEIPEAVGGALYLLAQDIMTKAKQRTPVARVAGGTLRQSGYVAPPEWQGSDIVIELGYGTDYAAPVHEMTDPGVQWNAEGTGPKYLENAVKDAQPSFGTRLLALSVDNVERNVGMHVLGEHPTAPQE